MKKISLLAFSTVLVIGISMPFTPVVDASTKAKTYKNCTELNKVYKGGVARTSSAKNKGGKTKYKPFVSKEIYDANKKSDRDNDMIACER